MKHAKGKISKTTKWQKKKGANKKGKINVGVVIGNMQNLHEMQKKGKKKDAIK